MKEYYIVTEQLSVGYGKQPVIENIEIKLQRGQILTLIGPNGAGKSTILKSITKQLKLLCGTVCIGEESLEQMSGRELAKKMSAVMTERVRTELMTCEDVVATGRHPYTGKFGILSLQDKKIVKKSMELVHVEHLADVDFTQISDGQRQKVLLARALCQEPEIIVLDEPTSFLDIRHKLELLTILKDLVREKSVTVVMSLHEIDLAQKISDIVLCIHKNRIEKQGTPEEVFTPGYIAELYEMTSGSYNIDYGCLEMELADGEPQVFVIGGNGTGIEIYRRLQRQGVPFAAGVLHENDMDYPIAVSLAAEVVTERAYEPISEENLNRAKQLIKSCENVIVCNHDFRSINAGNGILAQFAKEKMEER